MGAGDRQPAAGRLTAEATGAPADGDRGEALPSILDVLACPHCRGGLRLDAASLLCARGHRFDVARQGYVNLLRGGRSSGTGDTAAMVAARLRIHAAGHLDPLTGALVRAATDAGRAGGRVLDLGAGPGRHLAAVVDALPGARGLALDLSKPAMRRAARAHPRIAAVVADAWNRLPLRDGAVDLALAVFAPRDAAELARVLGGEGALILATPAPGHLRELAERLDLLAVDPAKADRLERAFAGALAPVRRDRLRYRMALPHAHARDVVLMGPNAWHTTAEAVDRRLRGAPDPLVVSAEIDLTIYRRTG